MDKNTLSNYGWIVIAVLVLSVMIALATPFGSYIEQGIKNTTTGLFEVENNSMSIAQVAVGLPDPRLSHNGTIKEGATYYVGVTGTTVGDYSGATATYTEGDAFPEPHIGDVYVYGDYEYRYNKYFDASSWSTNETQNGWGVRVINVDKEQYEPMLNQINNTNVSILIRTYSGCKNLTSLGIPKLSINATTLKYCFYGCESLTDATTLVIPKVVTDMTGTFYECESLTKPPIIPNGVLELHSTFAYCSQLQYAPKLPESTKNLNSAFAGCESLMEAPIIPSNVQNTGWAFNGCIQIKKAPKIPDKVKNIDGMFYGCLALENVPEIPTSVTSMNNSFYRCESLKDVGYLSIPSSVVKANGAFGCCIELINPPNLKTATKLQEASQMFFNCTKLKTAPHIPSTLQDMTKMFQHCQELVGVIEINANPSAYDLCFDNTTKQITLVGNSNVLIELSETDNQNNVNIR